MKRLNNVFDKIISLENLNLALDRAARGKKWQRGVRNVLEHREQRLAELHELLASGRYEVSAYQTKTIYEPKKRLLHILPFYPDRIIQHAIMNVFENFWDGLMIYDSYACRIGKGQHKGSIRCMRHVRRYRYVLKCDVSKFYPSLNHDILKRVIKRKIKDRRLLDLLFKIIDSNGSDVGVPIGSYLSQWFGNLYLNELDVFVKHTKRIKAYLRYCDDFVLFSDSKSELDELRTEIRDVCANLKLRLSKAEIFPARHGVDFLGYRHFPDGKILLRKRTARRVKAKISKFHRLLRRRVSKRTAERLQSSIGSMEGWMRHANTYNLRLSLQIDTLKERIKELL